METLKEALNREYPQAEQSSLISHEPGKWVLTKEEEEAVIRIAKRQAAEHLAWRMKDKGCFPEQIRLRLLGTDWEKEINRDEVLNRANRGKIRQIEDENRRMDEYFKRKEQAEKLAKECDSEYFYKLMKKGCRDRGFELVETPDTLKLIKLICLFMSRDERFESETGYDLKKGLLLRGTCGLGKTFLFDLVKENPLRSVKMMSMIEITEEVQSEGYFNPGNYPVLYFDDLGSERETVNHFGNKINWFKDFFEIYYLHHKKFSDLVVSTNLSFDELEQRYGYRFRSRVKEVFNVVNITGEDLRK